MCGIAGILQFDGAPLRPDPVQRMTEMLAHRGPDGQGLHVSGSLGLGHRRLAILDLSPAGNQPMANEDQSIWITYNGEIYNFKELRSELMSAGHIFRSASDTEVIIHAYEQWGMACLSRFNGMFAFALWDENKNILWLVRDRLGLKPLFYSFLPNGLLFGSEIKAILSHPDVARTIDYEALSYFLALNYVPAPFTLLSGVRQLLPGHYLTIDRNGRSQTVEYWQLIYREKEDCDEKKCIEEFRYLLEDSIRQRLVSDVPFGVFLSGGIDSSTIAYWMSRHMQQPIKSFSIGFNESSFNELPYARKLVKRIHAVHHEKIVSLDAVASLPKLVWHAEEPTADSSMMAFYHLAQLARQHVKMALGGDGADEILAGYETYQAYYLRRFYRCLPAFLRKKVITPVINALPSCDSKVSWDYRLKRFVKCSELSPDDAHASWRMIFDAEMRKKLLAPLGDRSAAMKDVLDLYHDLFSKANARHPLNRLLFVDTRFYLPNDMLVKVDRMTMAHGLETREPFLDYRLVEFAASLPPKFKLRHLIHKKYILKAAARGRLPATIIRRSKKGFNIPHGTWMKHDLKSYTMDLLSKPHLNHLGFLDDRFVAKLLQEHFAGKADFSHQIWGLMTLVHWWDQFIRINP